MIRTQHDLDAILNHHHGKSYVQASDGLHLRPAPSLESAVLMTMPGGDVFTLDGQSSLGFVGGTFGGEHGWAFAEYLSLGGQPLHPPVADGTTTTVLPSDGLNLRSGPSLEAAVIVLMPEGAGFTLDGRSVLGFLHGTHQGQTGWAFAEYLGDHPAPPPPPDCPGDIDEWANIDALADMIQQAADQSGAPVNLIKAVMKLESDGIWQISPAGAIGFMQVMPNWRHDLNLDIDDHFLNILAGAKILLIKKSEGDGSWADGIRRYHGYGWDGFTTDLQYLHIVNCYWQHLGM